MKNELTLEQLKEMKPGQIIATGVEPNDPQGIYMTEDGGNLRWVAVRGGIHDWAIYCHWDYSSVAYITQSGDKVHNRETIRKLVPCTDEAFEMYRD